MTETKPQVTHTFDQALHCITRYQASSATSRSLTGWIHGSFCRNASASDPIGERKHFDTLDPATGTVLATFQEADEAVVDQAVDSAEKGFRIWSQKTGLERGRVLSEAARLIRLELSELAALETLDSGKPITEAIADVISCAETLEYFAGAAAQLRGSTLDLGNAFVYTRKEPLGVCASIGAWNYPLQIATWKSAPALAAGNAVVFKPSELTPLSALRLAEIYLQAGLPEGAFNLVLGGPSVGKLLCSHPKVRKISLTGSVQTGKKILSESYEPLRPVTLELGGKSPLILFQDADLQKAVPTALWANFYTQGEVCSNATRVFVHEDIYEAFLDQLVPLVSDLSVGDPRDPATQIGALISRPHLEKVKQFLSQAKKDGAHCLVGGTVPRFEGRLSQLNQGNFISPTVFTHCHDTMTHVREEIFGPVMSVLKFRDEEEVIERANQTHFGLAAGVFTKDLSKAHRVIHQLQAGTCWINQYNLTPLGMPFGGTKNSGLGRENSVEAMDSYTQIKSVYVPTT